MKVYKITNIINKKCYVGITTRCISKRFKEHIEAGLYDKTKNSPLHSSIKKYGKNCFKVDVLYTATDFIELCRMEQYYIKELNTMIPNGYNLLPGGHNNYKLTDHHIMKISKPIKAENIKTGECFYFISLTEPNKRGYSSGSISTHIRDKTPYKGYIWSHVLNEEYLQNKDKFNIKKVANFYAKNIKTGEVITVYYGEPVKKYGFSPHTYKRVLRKDKWRKSHRGWIFSYTPFENEPVLAQDMLPQG